MKFSPQQEIALKQGALNNTDLTIRLETALGIRKLGTQDKRHHYICSAPGAGKTHTAMDIIDKHQLKVEPIHSVASMSAFVAKIAHLVYTSNGKPIQVWVDDCDSLLYGEDNLNIFKGILDDKREVLAYNKNLVLAIAALEASPNANEQLVGEALRHFQVPGSYGVQIPMHNVTFLFTSNKELCPPKMEGKTTKQQRAEQPVRDRFSYKGYSLNQHGMWGWVAHTALGANIHGISMAQKHELLTWMWDNWDSLPAYSMRTVKELAAKMLNYPDDYHTHWSLYLA